MLINRQKTLDLFTFAKKSLKTENFIFEQCKIKCYMLYKCYICYLHISCVKTRDCIIIFCCINRVNLKNWLRNCQFLLWRDCLSFFDVSIFLLLFPLSALNFMTDSADMYSDPCKTSKILQKQLTEFISELWHVFYMKD